MPPTTLTHTTVEVPGREYQKRAVVHDAQTGRPICQRVGGIPYAVPLDASQRWKRARPLPADFRYGAFADSPADFSGLANECPQPAVSGHDMPRQNEDCLQMNVFVPEGQRPREGWPVFFYIYGGFLQWGSPNLEDPVSLYLNTPFRAIFVAPTYRLNAFGFLASAELQSEAASSSSTIGNLGFWDQRLALEFVAAEIHRYGGNPANITVAGLSAGAYSTFHQLAYSLSLPADRAHIRRVVMWSNGCGLQPKSGGEVQGHFDALAVALGVPKDLKAEEKLVRLRALPWKKIAKAVEKVPVNAFRAVTDGVFVRSSLFAELHSGAFAAKMRERGVRIMCGDVRDEFNSYRLVGPPRNYPGLVQRLAVEYSEAAADRLGRIYCPGAKLPAGFKSWQDVFGRIYADMQVHVTQRGLVQCLWDVLPPKSVLRYRIETRAKCVDSVQKPEMGVAHGTDLAYWFWGHCFGIRQTLTEEEGRIARKLLLPFWRFVEGKEEVEWQTSQNTSVRKLEDGGRRVRVSIDPLWEDDLNIWRALHGLGQRRL